MNAHAPGGETPPQHSQAESNGPLGDDASPDTIVPPLHETAMPRDAEAPAAHDTLSLLPGRRLGDFLITRVVGHGGFGIVYEAEDLTLQRRVAIKEYMPAQLAARIDESRVQPISSRYAKTFDLGRRSFLAEARLLAQFHHPGLLEVLHFWEQNGTAYMVMPFYEGRTLEQVLSNGPDVVSESWLKSVIRPVLDALEHMHASDCYHRDVSADNILIRDGGKALLLDLGAARRVIGDRERALTVMLKPGYAPIEQYADDPTCKQGPWTDIYAVAAVLYFAVTNRMPPASASRVMHDSLPALATQMPAGYGRRFLEAIDRGLSIRPEQRPRTIGEFRSMLFAASPEDALAAAADETGKGIDAVEPPVGPTARRVRFPYGRGPLAAVAAACLAAIAIAWFAFRASGVPGDDAAPAAEPSAQAAADDPARSRGDAGPTATTQAGTDEADTAGTSADDVGAGARMQGDRAAAPQPDEPASAAGGSPQLEANDAAAGASIPGAYSGVLVQPPVSKRAAGASSPSRAAAHEPAPATGLVLLSIAPWGEVFVDGVSRGVTPPVKRLSLSAGAHRIEVRNPASKTWQQEIVVRAGEQVDLSHRFR